MPRRCDVLIIGTGTAAQNVAHPCARAGLDVAVVDARRYGGTCARRGCQPKKFLVAAAEIVGLSRQLAGRGIGEPARLDWPALIRSKRDFTDAVPGRTEHGFEKAGITNLHGRARLTAPDRVVIEGEDAGEVRARRVVIATGARPRPLPLEGAELLLTSEDFLELEALPRRLVCVGAGFISLEFAHVAARAGVAVTILGAAERILEAFDPDLTERLAAATRAAGIELHTGDPVTAAAREGGELVITTESGRRVVADLALHGAGRVPDLDGLGLEAGEVAHDERGVTVDSGLRSTTNPAVFAVGDAAAHPPMLAPVADLEGAVVAANLIADRQVRQADFAVVPSVVFTQPPLAAVGMTAAEAEAAGAAVVTSEGDMSDWPASRRLGQDHAAHKLFLDAASGRILGAHVLGHGAPDVVNVFALAIARGLTAADLQALPWAYPTATSDLKHMLPEPGV
jgi:glutathione reductase (NADPH)